MDILKFKKIIKEVVKESIQEELKDILLEALKSSKGNNINEHIPIIPQPSKELNTFDRRAAIASILGETQKTFTSNDIKTFTPRSIDPINGTLPEGELGMDQILGLLNTKQ
jgi:hypothetical protein